jgi:hypothetical protein
VVWVDVGACEGARSVHDTVAADTIFCVGDGGVGDGGGIVEVGDIVIVGHSSIVSSIVSSCHRLSIHIHHWFAIDVKDLLGFFGSFITSVASIASSIGIGSSSIGGIACNGIRGTAISSTIGIGSY